MIKIEVNSTRAVIRSQEPLTVGLRGAKVHFSFGTSWAGLIKTAVFRQGETVRAVANVGSAVTVPWEVLTQPGVPVEIGVYGIDKAGAVAIPTVWAKTQPVLPGTDPEANPSADPTPALWEQMQTKLGELGQLETKEKSSLVEAINEVNRPVFVVTVTKNADGTYTANKTQTELTEAFHAGKTLICRYYEDDVYLNLTSLYGMAFKFSAVLDHYIYQIVINGAVGRDDVVIFTKTDTDVPTKTSQLENDSNFWYGWPRFETEITIDENGNYIVNDNAYGIYYEYNLGQIVFCKYGELVLSLTYASEEKCIFSGVHDGGVHTVVIDDDEGVSYTTTPLSSVGSGNGAAVLYTAQDLTAEQKAQARENIGVNKKKEIEVVLQDVGADLVGASVKTVFDAVDAGDTVVLYRNTEDGKRIFYQLEEVETGSDGSKTLTFNHKSKTLVQCIHLTLGGLLDGGFGSVGVGTEILTANDVGAVPAPVTAEIGQAMCVTAVDESGKPTQWEATDFPAGGGEWEKIFELTAEEKIGAVSLPVNGSEYQYLVLRANVQMWDVAAEAVYSANTAVDCQILGNRGRINKIPCGITGAYTPLEAIFINTGDRFVPFVIATNGNQALNGTIHTYNPYFSSFIITDSVSFGTWSASHYLFTEGSTFELWGVRK